MASPFEFFATCAKGTEGALRRELVALRVTRVRGDRGGVWFAGELEAGMKVCLHSRTAVRVLLQLGSFEAAGSDALYEAARKIDWAEWVTPKTTIAVEASVRDSEVTHSHYAALKVKDAVVDALREATGNRPDVDPHAPDVPIVLHLAGDRATLALDLAGEPLHRRGYRVGMSEAPLKENLAAAVLALGGVLPEAPFIDPMCGSGTLAIEQALAARRVPAGHRRAFAFQHWPRYRGALQSSWDRLLEAARAAVLPAAQAPILARDRSPEAVELTRRNATAAGVGADIRVELGDVRDLRVDGPAGAICCNPPYGERLSAPPRAAARTGERPGGRGGQPGRGGRDDRGARAGRDAGRGGDDDPALRGLYEDMAAAFRGAAGWDVVVLSGHTLFEHVMRLKPKISHRLFNGALEVRLLKYHIR